MLYVEFPGETLYKQPTTYFFRSLQNLDCLCCWLFVLLLHLSTNFVQTFQRLESSQLMIISRDIGKTLLTIILRFLLKTFSKSVIARIILTQLVDLHSMF